MQLFYLILIIAIVLAGLHMLAPDHWIPLTVVAGRMNFSRRRTLATAGLLGILHAGTSATVALLALLLGMVLVKIYLNYLQYVSIALLIIVGVYFILNGYRERNSHDNPSSASVTTVLSVSIFPDLALMPLLLSGITLSSVEIGIVIVAFAVISALSLSLMVYGTSKGFSRAVERLPPRYVDYIMGSILFITAALLKFI